MGAKPGAWPSGTEDVYTGHRQGGATVLCNTTPCTKYYSRNITYYCIDFALCHAPRRIQKSYCSPSHGFPSMKDNVPERSTCSVVAKYGTALRAFTVLVFALSVLRGSFFHSASSVLAECILWWKEEQRTDPLTRHRLFDGEVRIAKLPRRITPRNSCSEACSLVPADDLRTRQHPHSCGPQCAEIATNEGRLLGVTLSRPVH